MIDATFSRGTGCGSGPVDYVLGKGQDRKPQPQVIRGNPETTRDLIDSLDFKNKYCSGVLDWTEGEEVSPEQEQDIIEQWEKAHFAGLEKDQYNVLWVRHTDAGHHELHYVIPKVELTTGKSLNPKPPGQAKVAMGDTFRRIVNLENNWADPDDPERKRMGRTASNEEIKAGIADRPLNETKELIGQIIEQQEQVGLIQSRDDVLATIKGLGFEIARETSKSISIINPESTRNIRLTGGYYANGYKFEPALEKATGGKPDRNPEAVKRELAELKPKLECLSEKRNEFNNSRYSIRQQADYKLHARDAERSRRSEGRNASDVVANDALSKPNLSDYLTDRLGLDAIHHRQIPNKNNNNGKNDEDLGEVRRSNSVQQVRWEDMRQDRYTSPSLSRWVQDIKTEIGVGYDRIRGKINGWIEDFERATEATARSFTGTSEQLEFAGATINKAIQHNEQTFSRGVAMIRNNRSSELERFKTEINLPDFLAGQGYQFDKKTSSKDSVCMRNGYEKLIITTDQAGHGIYFDVRNDNNQGTIIDWVQKHKQMNLGQVRKELRPVLNIPEPTTPSVYKPKPITRDHAQVVHSFKRMEEVTSHSYLSSRGIDNLSDDRFTVMKDPRGNAIFPHYKENMLTGYGMKNNNFESFSKGGEKGLWISNNIEEAKKVYISESTIDSLSLAQMQPEKNAAYISIEGSMSPVQKEELKRILDGKQPISAVDNDKGGDDFTKQFQEILGVQHIERIKPLSKDWNKDLTNQIEQQAQAQQSRNNDRGLTLAM